MRKLAFTLVELLIVVIILGILAAVVIPQFSDASNDARLSSLQTNLATVRGQIELYKLQHSTVGYPPLATFGAKMTSKTDADGTVNAATGKYGPYLQAVPINPFSTAATTALQSAVNAPSTPAANLAWSYDATTGVFKADTSAAHAAY